MRARRGVALLDAILGGVILGIGLAAVLSLSSRSLGMHAQGQKQLAAAWLADELLAMVLVEGPVAYQQLYPTAGRFDPPFEEFAYDVDIDDIGLGRPFRVTAVVRWPHGRGWNRVETQTYIAERRSETLEIRAPLEPIDRMARYLGDVPE